MQNSRINSKLKWKNRNAHSNLIEQSNKTLDNSIYLFYFPTLLSRISKPDLRKQTYETHLCIIRQRRFPNLDLLRTYRTGAQI